MSVPRSLVAALALGIALLGVSCLQPVDVGFNRWDSGEVEADAGIDAGACLACP